MNRKKLFEVMRCYRVHEKLVRLIERFYDGSMVKFELEKLTTGWCKSDYGLIGMVKYAAEQSGSKYVIRREGWKNDC